MFVMHLMRDGQPTRTRDFGHVNQFLRMYPIFRDAKGEEVFEECIAQGFIYIHHKDHVEKQKHFYTYQKSIDLLLTEVAYNRNTHGY
ncbi:hypothetical protein AU156_gp235 [Edwardsiella phage PEi20]|uniref:Uncharacterized protein n=2 Tax=Kanagawavirus pei20 TaxID=2844109 RepID=A0A0B6VRM5_9CAUD|nr:hypothetical protein AU156_gp235 [Edwardsiella phage PEi20]BAQ22866.1 conserved hypothetical protein [Edwardsiella phage PEi20]BAQ23169.1 conserved hypothetical protein [Edwardsiella phage PEi26]